MRDIIGGDIMGNFENVIRKTYNSQIPDEQLSERSLRLKQLQQLESERLQHGLKHLQHLESERLQQSMRNVFDKDSSSSEASDSSAMKKQIIELRRTIVALNNENTDLKQSYKPNDNQDYIILTSHNMVKITKDVNRMLNAGYNAQGGISKDDGRYCQAMIKASNTKQKRKF